MSLDSVSSQDKLLRPPIGSYPPAKRQGCMKESDTRYQFGMRVLWLILIATSAAVGWVQLTILVR
jgi:hypothetical protein